MSDHLTSCKIVSMDDCWPCNMRWPSFGPAHKSSSLPGSCAGRPVSASGKAQLTENPNATSQCEAATHAFKPCSRAWRALRSGAPSARPGCTRGQITKSCLPHVCAHRLVCSVKEQICEADAPAGCLSNKVCYCTQPDQSYRLKHPKPLFHLLLHMRRNTPMHEQLCTMLCLGSYRLR